MFYEAEYTVNVTVNHEDKLTEVEEALRAAAEKLGTSVSVVELDITETETETDDA